MKKMTAVTIQMVMELTPMMAGATKVSSTRMPQMVNKMVCQRLTFFLSFSI